MARTSSIRLCLVLLVGSFIAAGCASSGQTINATPPAAKLGSYKRVLVKVTSAVADSSQETLQLESMVVSSLRDAKVFEAVNTASGGGAGDLRIDANITDLRKVSGAKRAMLGGLAGRGNLTVDVKLVETGSGKQVGSFTAQGTTSGGTIFAGTTEQAIQLAAKQIADYVRTNM